MSLYPAVVVFLSLSALFAVGALSSIERVLTIGVNARSVAVARLEVIHGVSTAKKMDITAVVSCMNPLFYILPEVNPSTFYSLARTVMLC